MADTVSVTCPECGKAVKIPEELLGRKLRCKGCDESFVARASRAAEKKSAKKPEPAAKKPEKKPAAVDPDADDDDNGQSYGLTEEYLGARCPECAEAMADEDIVCLNCGYNTRTRERADTKSVEDITGLDYFLWWLPGILCVIAFFGLIGFDIWYCLDINRVVGSEWYSFIAHGSIKLWLVIFSCWPAFYAAKFAIKRLIMNNQPPERLKRNPT